MIVQFLAGMISCVGFAYLLNCPQKHILRSAVAGGFGWLAYYYVSKWGASLIVSTLIGTIVLSTCCEICARLYKDAVSVFTIPAILPLVPGAGVYHTLVALIAGDYTLALSHGMNTLGCALSIAIGIIIVSSIFKIFFTNKKGLSSK